MNNEYGYQTSVSVKETKEEAFQHFRKNVLDRVPNEVKEYVNRYLNIEFLENNNFLVDRDIYSGRIKTYKDLFSIVYKENKEIFEKYTSTESQQIGIVDYTVEVITGVDKLEAEDIRNRYRITRERLEKGVLTDYEIEKLAEYNEDAYDEYEMLSEKEFIECEQRDLISNMRESIRKYACIWKTIVISEDDYYKNNVLKRNKTINTVKVEVFKKMFGYNVHTIETVNLKLRSEDEMKSRKLYKPL